MELLVAFVDSMVIITYLQEEAWVGAAVSTRAKFKVMVKVIIEATLLML